MLTLPLVEATPKLFPVALFAPRTARSIVMVSLVPSTDRLTFSIILSLLSFGYLVRDLCYLLLPAQRNCSARDTYAFVMRWNGNGSRTLEVFLIGSTPHMTALTLTGRIQSLPLFCYGLCFPLFGSSISRLTVIIPASLVESFIIAI